MIKGLVYRTEPIDDTDVLYFIILFSFLSMICIFFCRYDKDISNQNFLQSSSSPFSSDFCDPHSWLLDTNTVREKKR